MEHQIAQARQFSDQAFVQSLEGAEIARLLSIATFTLVLYEYVITLDDEMKCFWRGGWSKSRVLFLANRYLTPVIIAFPLFCFSTTNPTPEFCRPAIKACFILTVLVLGIVQAILVLRVYYLFSNSRLIRNITIAAFIVSVSLSLGFATVASVNLRSLEPLVAFHINGCRAERPKGFWRIYLPPLVLHTLLYIFTVMRAVQNRQMLKKSPVMQRLLKDGGIFYLVTFASVGFTGTGAFLKDAPHLNIPATFSNFVLGITSICVSRIMLSIQSLAAKLGSDTAWLLNNVELSRVRWRPGAYEGELIVDLDPAYEEEERYNRQDIEYNRRMYNMEMADIKSKKDDRSQPTQIAVRTTRVGTFSNTNGFYTESFLTLKS